MRTVTTIEGPAAPLPFSHVDTDQLLPSRYMKTISRQGLGAHLFHDWRFDAAGAALPDFVLNRPPFQDAPLLVALENFGCGSSREHAVWALDDFGIRGIVATSFGDIFRTNCIKNGILPVALPLETCRTIIARLEADPTLRMRVDLPSQRLDLGDAVSVDFEITPGQKQILLDGLDDISRTLRHVDAIAAFEARHDGIS